MSIDLPDLAAFRSLAQPGTLVPVYRQLMADQLTPVLAYRRLVAPDDRMAPSFLLESVVAGEQGQSIARYSYMGAQPIMQVLAHRNRITCRDHREPSNTRSYVSDDPLGELAKISAAWKLAPVEGLPDFTGGWVGFAGYDTVRYLEPEKLTNPPEDDRGLPDYQMGLYRQVVAFDHVRKTILLITHVLIDEHDSTEAAYDAAVGELDAMMRRIQTPLPRDHHGLELPIGTIDLATAPRKLPTSSLGEGGYQQAVEVCKKYIAAGDAFQIVPSQRFELVTKADPFDLYRALRMVNPSPYMFYLQIDGAMLVGSSPEILCRVHNGEMVNRPLAGTRKRGRDVAEDQALEQELLADPKDRAEHIMLVDLGRNDLGRVAVPGSIRLPQVLTVERYSHVMHISSTVTGTMRAGYTCWDVLRYTLPVGTVSGAPKVRAMQIIDELEKTRRGPYAGAVGYADFAGNMDMAIALRTMVVLPSDSEQWKVHIQAGGGIVADSDPQAEHEETVNKAAALAKAVDLAEHAFLSTD